MWDEQAELGDADGEKGRTQEVISGAWGNLTSGAAYQWARLGQDREQSGDAGGTRLRGEDSSEKTALFSESQG